MDAHVPASKFRLCKGINYQARTARRAMTERVGNVQRNVFLTKSKSGLVRAGNRRATPVAGTLGANL
eukprot:1139574-Pelagomonas_calceolata.AAC.10